MDNDAFRIVARLDVPKSAKLIKEDIPKLENQLKSDKIKIKAELNIAESKKLIQTQLDTLTNQSKAPTIKVGIDTSAVKKAVKDTSAQISNSNKSNQLQLFDSKKLDADGRKYFYKTTDIINRVKNYYLKNGALNVDISSLETAKGQIQSFTATVEESTGVIKKFNFEKANINSKNNSGFVQTDSLKSIDKNAGTNLKSTLNFLSQIDEKIMSVQSKTTKQSNPLKEGTTYYDNYNKKLTETVSKIEEIKNANKTLSTEQKNEIRKMITELSLYAKEQQKLAYPPLISSTSIDDSVEKAKATLSTLEQKWKTQGILTGEFKSQVASLRTELDQVGNTEGLKKYNTSLKLVQESAKQLLLTQKQAEQASKADDKAQNDLRIEFINKLNNAYKQLIANKNKLTSTTNEDSKAAYTEEINKTEILISNLTKQLYSDGLITNEIERQIDLLNEQVALTDRINRNKASDAKEKQLKDYENQIDKVVIKLNSLSNSSVFSKNSSNPQVAQTKQEFANLTKEYQKLMTQIQGDVTPAGFETLRSELDKLNTRFNSACASAEQFERELKDDNSAEQLAQKVSVLTARVEAFRKANRKSEKLFGGEYDRILSQLSDPNIDLETYNRLNKEFQKLRLEINKADKAGQSFFGKLKDQATKFASWMTLTGIIAGAWREVRKMITEVVELDNSLLELSKVSDLTADGLKQITTEAYSLGKEVGKTGTQVIDAITNFKRAGFDLQQSTSFAKDALILTNVAEGIDDASEAATALISIMKGYGDTTPEFSQKILDSINEVSNTQAINFDDLVDGSQRLSAVAKQAGASFEEMLGILTGTNEVLQNIEKTSSGEITIFTRLQGIQLPDEEDVMPIAKLQETISTATKGAANVVDQTSGELRNVYDILDDINKVWDTLDKNTQEGIAFAAAGTRQKNVFLSMMQNWENVKKATESAMDSTGSATKENQKYLDSIQGKLSTLQSTFQSLSNTVINSDLIKFVVDGGTNILNILDKIIDKVGTLPTILGGVATVLSFKNVGELQNKNTPVSIQPQIICIDDVTRFKIRLSNCWDDYAKAL